MVLAATSTVGPAMLCAPGADLCARGADVGARRAILCGRGAILCAPGTQNSLKFHWKIVFLCFQAHWSRFNTEDLVKSHWSAPRRAPKTPNDAQSSLQDAQSGLQDTQSGLQDAQSKLPRRQQQKIKRLTPKRGGGYAALLRVGSAAPGLVPAHGVQSPIP